MRYIKISLREKAVPTLLDRGSTFETLEIFVGGDVPEAKPLAGLALRASTRPRRGCLRHSASNTSRASHIEATPRNALNYVDRKSFDLRVLPLSSELSTYKIVFV